MTFARHREELQVKRYFIEIEQVFAGVTQALPKVEGNPCGECRSCCSVRMKSHRVSRLEFDFLAHHIGDERTSEFRRYIAREKTQDGGFVYENCPLLNEYGCSVHEIRPYSCRLYGHIRNDKTELLSECVFRGSERVVPKEHERHMLPEHPRLIELVTEYNSYFAPPDHEVEQVENPLLQTELDLAMHYQVSGRYDEARVLIQKMIAEEGERFLLLQMLGETSEALKDYLAAVEAFGKALHFTPENPELHYRLGCNLFWLNRYDEAGEALEEALRIDPQRSRCLGFLGFVRQFQGLFDQAADYYRRAVDTEDKPGLYRFQLGYALEQLGRRDEAQTAYEKALEFEPTEAMARDALALLKGHPASPGQARG